MTRDEMIKKLQSLPCLIEITALPSEGALEVECLTHVGSIYEWLGINDWPLYRLDGVTKHLLENVQNMLQDNALTESKIRDTILYRFWNTCKESFTGRSIREFFIPLMDIIALENDQLYAIFDPDKDSKNVKYFSSYADISNHLSVYFKHCNNAWVNMSDEDLGHWMTRIDEGFGSNGIPFICFNME